MTQTYHRPFLGIFAAFSFLFAVGCTSAPGDAPKDTLLFCEPPESLASAAGMDICPSDEEGPEATVRVMVLDVQGLFTNPNPIGQQIPAGGLKKANDIVIDRPGVATPRRADDGIVLTSLDPGQVNIAFDYAGTSFAWSGAALYTLDTSSGDADFTSVGALSWSGGTLRHATGGGDLYVTSDDGPLLLDGPTGTPKLPGAPRAFDIVSVNIQSGTAIPNNVTFAHRVVHGRNDSEGRPVLGEPSGPFKTTTNAAGPYKATVTVRLQAENVAGDFIQVYRTQDVPAGGIPGDTLFQTAEHIVTSADILAGTVQIEDITPDELLGVPLYTNPDRGGVRSSNVRPPLAQDLTTFRERMWLANTQAPQRFTLRMIAVPDDGDSLTIGGVVYTGGATEDATTGAFENFVGGATISADIAETTRSLVRVINGYAANTTITAYSISGEYDAAGIILLEARSVTAAAFTVQASARGERYIPALTTAISSLADEYPNRLHYSKPGIFYGFPLPNTLQVGAEEHGIARIVALRDTLLVFKEAGGDGLWKVTGNGPFYVEQVNAGVHVLAPDTVVVADNTAFALTDKGVIAVSESGSVDVISVPIEDKIRDFILQHPGSIQSARAFVREANTEEKVYFGFDTDDDLAYVEESYVWNIATETWTRDTRPWRAAYIRGDGRMLRFIETDPEMQVFVERNSGDLLADTLGVSYEVGWNTETGDSPAGQKQFTHANVLFEQTQPASVDAEMWFTADDGSQGPAVETGGEGFPYIRAEVPVDQQRTSRLGVEIRATVTTTQANIVGVSTMYRTYGALKGR
jgi:hypothetical protein